MGFDTKIPLGKKEHGSEAALPVCGMKFDAGDGITTGNA